MTMNALEASELEAKLCDFICSAIISAHWNAKWMYRRREDYGAQRRQMTELTANLIDVDSITRRSRGRRCDENHKQEQQQQKNGRLQKPKLRYETYRKCGETSWVQMDGTQSIGIYFKLNK